MVDAYFHIIYLCQLTKLDTSYMKLSLAILLLAQVLRVEYIDDIMQLCLIKLLNMYSTKYIYLCKYVQRQHSVPKANECRKQVM